MKEVYKGSPMRDNNDFLESSNFNINHVVNQTKERRLQMEKQIKENQKRLEKLVAEGGNYSDLKPFKELKPENQLMWATQYDKEYKNKEALKKPKYIPYP
jgi:hypothetical protein